MDPSILSIAKAAGVSKATASYALRDSPKISVETRGRVQSIAREMGYSPDSGVQALMARLQTTRKAHYHETIAVLSGGSTADAWRHPFSDKFIAGASERAAKMGYALAFFWLGQPGMTARRMASILHARGISGALVIGHSQEIEKMDWRRLSPVSLDNSARVSGLHRASSHNIHGISMACEMLRSKGYRRIGLAVAAAAEVTTEHAVGLGMYLFQKGIPKSDRVPPYEPPVLESVGFRKWFEKFRPDAVLSYRGDIPEWMAGFGVRVPHNAAYVNLAWHDRLFPPSAGISQNEDIVGAAAVDLIIAQLTLGERGMPAHPKTVLIEPSWVDGPTVRSTRPVPRSGRSAERVSRYNRKPV